MNGAAFRSRWTHAFVAAAAVLVLLSACVLPGASTETVSTALDSPPRAAPPSTPTPRTFYRLEDHFFDVLTLNTALLPEYASYTQPAARMPRLAQHLAGYDALVLQEAFVDTWRERILDELADSYPYRGELVGHDGARGLPLRQDGGIVILSRWPIVRQATMLFEATCSGLDCLSDKGVAYVAVKKGERTYHLFGTHAQSEYGWSAPAVRAAQFELFAAFIAQQEIPEDEIVLLAGDFNVDAYTPELDSMLLALGVHWPPVIGNVTATWDPSGNAWADGGRAWLDYVLVANGYGTPAAAWNRAVPLRADGLDLSDHYAVWGRVAVAPAVIDDPGTRTAQARCRASGRSLRRTPAGVASGSPSRSRGTLRGPDVLRVALRLGSQSSPSTTPARHPPPAGPPPRTPAGDTHPTTRFQPRSSSPHR